MNLKRAALLLALLTPLASAHAQGPKWRGWIGCWSVVPTGEEPLPGRRLVCIAPTSSPDAVEFVAIADSAILSRDTVDASGRALAVKAVGCNGSRAATWSSDERRVYLRSDVVCDGLRTNVSAILAMTAKGEWLDVRRIAAGEGADLRVARYRDAAITGAVPREIASAIRASSARDESARIASGAPSGTSAVIDASRAVHPDVVEAWVVESGEQFAADKAAIQELARAGVAGNVSSAVIASADAPSPSRPWIDDYIRPPYGRGASDFWDQGTGMRLVGADAPVYDPWGFGYGPFGDRVYNSAVDGAVLAVGSSNSQFGRGFGYGPNGIGWGFGYGYYRKAPSGKSLISYYAPNVPVLHQDGGSSDSRTSLSAPAYPDQGQKAGSASTNAKPSGVAETAAKAVIDAATGNQQKKTVTKPR